MSKTLKSSNDGHFFFTGTEMNKHCEIGLDYYSFKDEECHNVTNNYQRMDCIEEALYAFEYFMSDPFNPEWSDVTGKYFESNRDTKIGIFLIAITKAILSFYPPTLNVIGIVKMLT